LEACCSSSEGMNQQKAETWCQNHLTNQHQHLYQLLEKIDRDFAEEARQKGCPYCKGKLHQANYARRPRGGPQWDSRYSFCCAAEGCRRRLTPESVRFLGRRVYAGLVVVLLAAMTHGLKAERVRHIRKVLQIDVRTLKRWRQWWLENFVRSRFWKGARARFLPILSEQELPWSLCERFGLEQRDQVVALLQFLAPITAPMAWKELAM
jgi:hypothetical protein